MRARYPDSEGFVERDGVRLFYEVYEGPEPSFLFLCPTPFSYSRGWKGQIPYLSRHFRALTFDGRGTGRSDRPRGTDAFGADALAEDALAVMDETGTDRAIVVGVSVSCRPALWLVAEHPERFAGTVFIAPYLPLTYWAPVQTMWRTFEESRAWIRALNVIWMTARSSRHMVGRSETSRAYRRFARAVPFFEGVRKFNRHYWLSDQHGAIEWIASALDFTEAHSTKQIEDAIGWGTECDAETLVDAFTAIEIVDRLRLMHRETILAHCSKIRAPVLAIHGEGDVGLPRSWGSALADATGGELVTVPNAGHVPQGRKPVAVNLALRTFGESVRASDGPGELISQEPVIPTTTGGDPR